MPTMSIFENKWLAYAVVSGSALLLLTFGALVFTIYKMDYTPFKAKQPYVLLTALIANTFWWVGTMHRVGIFAQEGLFSVCSVWNVWITVLNLIT
jgi:hypothetical protein